MKGSVLFDQAGKLEASGDIRNAADIYRQIVNKYPYSLTAKQAEQRLNVLSSKTQKRSQNINSENATQSTKIPVSVKASIAKKSGNSNSETAKQSPEIPVAAKALTALLGIIAASAVIWFFGFDLVLKGILGILLLAVIATGVGAVVVGVILFAMGKPVITVLPFIQLGIATAVIIGVTAGLLFLVMLGLSALYSKLRMYNAA